jgi:hypothetical protein
MRLILFSKLCVVFSLLSLAGFSMGCMNACGKSKIFEMFLTDVEIDG